MIIIRHPWIKSPNFYKVFSIEDIQSSRNDRIVLLEPLVDSNSQAQYCKDNLIDFAIVVNSLEDALFANCFGAKYIVCEEDEALMIQPIAQEYLFDTKVLVLINNYKSMNKIARSGIDGVIFPEAIF